MKGFVRQFEALFFEGITGYIYSIRAPHPWRYYTSFCIFTIFVLLFFFFLSSLDIHFGRFRSSEQDNWIYTQSYIAIIHSKAQISHFFLQLYLAVIRDLYVNQWKRNSYVSH